MKRSASLLIASLFAVFLVTTCITTALANSQINQHQDATSQNGTSDPRVLLLQPAQPSNATQASRALRAENITRIIVPISKVENTSSSSAQPFGGFEFPTWIWIPVIIVLLVILAYLFLKLLRDGDNEPPLDKRPSAPAPPSEARGQQSRQIPINIRTIPIETSEELREPDEDSL
jgi:hypothetical protein